MADGFAVSRRGSVADERVLSVVSDKRKTPSRTPNVCGKKRLLKPALERAVWVATALYPLALLRKGQAVAARSRGGLGAPPAPPVARV